MAVLIYIFLFLVMWGLSYVKFKKTLNIVSIFTGLWCFFGIISTFGMYGMRIPVFQVHLYAYLFVSVVDIIIILFCSNRHIPIEHLYDGINEKEKDHNQVNRTYATAIQIIALLFYLPMIINSFQAFLEDGFVGIRNAYFSTEYESRYIFSLLCKTMPTSFMTGLIVYYTYKSFGDYKWKYFLYAFLNAILLMFVNGGRYSLMQVILSAVVIMVMRQKNIQKEDKQERTFKRKIINGILAVVLVMFMVTLLREQEIIKNIIVYFSGSFSFLDYIISNPINFNLTERLSGYLTFGCVTEPIVLGLKVLGLTTVGTPSYLFNVVAQNFYNIGTGSEMLLFNNNTTALYYFLRDFGVIGIVIGGIFLASLLVYSYNKWMSGSKFYALLFVYMAVILLNSIMTYQLFACGPLFTIIAIYFCCKKSRIRLTRRK